MKKKEINEVDELGIRWWKDTRNDDRMLGARYGRYRGKEYLFTHRNPKNGDLYGEDIPIALGCWMPGRSLILGKWVSSYEVTFD